jgi:uncharacterized LabA/DUF88 family protein
MLKTVLGATDSMVLCTTFVDGGYIRGQLGKAGIALELDPRAIGEWLRRQAIIIGNRQVIVDRTCYYDAVDDQDEVMQTYLNRIEALPEVRVGNLGWLRRSRRRGLEQKAVDIQLAVDAMECAFLRRDGAIAVVAGDGDFEPLLDAIRRIGPYGIVVAFRDSLSQRLVKTADRVMYLSLPLPEDVQWFLNE